MLEYIKDLFSDNKTYAIFIATFIVAMIVVLFIIWWPEPDIEEFAKYEDVNIEQKLKEIGNSYMEKLMFYIRYGQAKQITSNISNGYLSYVGKTKSEVEEELFSKKVTAFRELRINRYENIVVYSTELVYQDNSTRRMNIVEYYPYNYSITFDDFIINENVNMNYMENGIDISISNSYCSETNRTYELRITNLKNDSVTIDIGNFKNIYIELANRERYYLNNTVVTTDLNNISRGTTINQLFAFAIPFSVQSKISKIVLSDVKIDGNTINIEVKI